MSRPGLKPKDVKTSAPTVKQTLAALHLFDWLVLGQVVTVNPAGMVGGSKNSVLRSCSSILLEPAEVHKLLDHIDVTTLGGLRDRALIGLMAYSFAGISAALGMKVEDVYNEQL